MTTNLRPFLITIISLLVVLFPSSCFVHGADSGGGRKAGKSSVFSLFNLKDKSRFWTESVIRTGFEDLEMTANPGKMGVFNYTKAGNIANFLMLQEVDYMYLPVPVNFIFVGFDGKGNEDFKLNPEELERWFTKIDHIFEHTRVPPLGEVLTPFYKVNVKKGQDHHLPIVSHLNYNFSVNAIQMGEKVTSVFEHAISVLARKDDVTDNRDEVEGLWQVDLDMMDVVFSSLVEYLQLENAYNLFILNPKHDRKRVKYGYRRGLSETEINFLKQNKSLQEIILRSESAKDNFLDLHKSKRPLYEKHPMTKFAWIVTEETDTVEWYNLCMDELNKVEKFYSGKNTSDVIQYKALQLLNGKNDDLKLPFEKELKSGNFGELHAECLTDTWVGKSRWAFIDLTAGPFSWGPAVGGEGVRTELSLPNVQKTIGSVTEISEDEAEDHLQDAIQEKFAVFGDKDHQAIDILLAEIDIYELFAFKHCKGRRVKLALCEELDERMQDLENELKSFEHEEYDDSHRRKAIEALKRMENWNLFSDAHEDAQNYTVARDSFLAHLGATLWGSMRHIVAPSVADGAFHYYEKISFQLFFITQEKIRNVKQLPVDLDAFKNGLSSLLLHSQIPSFSNNLLSLAEDHALAMAFSVARRTAAVPLLLVNGTYRKTLRSYIDSSILQYQLQRTNDITLKGSHAHSRGTLEIPIFWFFHDEPLLVDKHYLAKALPDMVIVAQSKSSSWESHLQCNGQSLLWDLRWPLKAALASVAEHLAGLLPLHLVYSHAHETAIEDWIWSVGCNPFSITSRGWQVSQFQLDTIARSYIITTLEESVLLVNSAIRRLLLERTSEKSFMLFRSNEQELVAKYNNVVRLWKKLSVLSGDLRYLDALGHLHSLEDSSQRFAEQVNTTIALLHPIHCTRDRKVHVVFDVTTVPAFFVVGVVLYVVLKPRRPKPKIN